MKARHSSWMFGQTQRSEKTLATPRLRTLENDSLLDGLLYCTVLVHLKMLRLQLHMYSDFSVRTAEHRLFRQRHCLCLQCVNIHLLQKLLIHDIHTSSRRVQSWIRVETDLAPIKWQTYTGTYSDSSEFRSPVETCQSQCRGDRREEGTTRMCSGDCLH